MPAAPTLPRPQGAAVLLEQVLRVEHQVPVRLLLSQLQRFQKWISGFIVNFFWKFSVALLACSWVEGTLSKILKGLWEMLWPANRLKEGPKAAESHLPALSLRMCSSTSPLTVHHPPPTHSQN